MIRPAIILTLTALAFLLPPSRFSVGCLVLAGVYALLTSPRRFL